jgi:hypothetical protein
VIPGPKIRIVFPEQENAERMVAPFADSCPQHLPFSTILLHAMLLMASDVHRSFAEVGPRIGISTNRRFCF